MSDTTQSDILPQFEDLVGAGLCAVSAMAYPKWGSPASNAGEQLVSSIAGRFMANYFDISNDLHSTSFSVREKDLMTGLVRGGYSLSQGRSNQRVGADALRGMVVSTLGAVVASNLKTKTA